MLFFGALHFPLFRTLSILNDQRKLQSPSEISDYRGAKFEIFLWDVPPCSLVKIDRRFRGAYFIPYLLMMEIVSAYETPVRQRNILEDSHLHTDHRPGENRC
jgi:hypothetical protein